MSLVIIGVTLVVIVCGSVIVAWLGDLLDSWFE